MAELLYEVWDDQDGGQEMWPVSELGDRQRALISPNAVHIHCFFACSRWDASRKLYAWNGHGEWRPPPGSEDHFFTDEEAHEQRNYLAVRGLNGSQGP